MEKNLAWKDQKQALEVSKSEGSENELIGIREAGSIREGKEMMMGSALSVLRARTVRVIVGPFF